MKVIYTRLAGKTHPDGNTKPYFAGYLHPTHYASACINSKNPYENKKNPTTIFTFLQKKPPRFENFCN